MTGKLTTHALDTQAGTGAAGLKVEVRRLSPDPHDFGVMTLDPSGRAVLIETGLTTGQYELVFHAAGYHRAAGIALSDPPFLDRIPLRFGVAEAGAHYHVPLLFTPFSYSTYRGG
jgi:5-hydroxyisourate hydrolase